MAMLAGFGGFKEPIGLVEIIVKTRVFILGQTLVLAGHRGRDLKVKVA